MVFISTGSRLDNPYSSPRGGASWKTLHSVPPRLWFLLAVLLMWLLAIISVVYENPEIKKEALRDIAREETFIRSKFQRGRLRVREWAKNERRWLRDRLDDPDDPSSSAAAAAVASSSSPMASLPEADDRKHEWDLTQLEDLALRAGPNDVLVHVIFSTDCGPYQHWQAYQFFLAALRVRQPGRVTQIASGCTDAEAKSLREWHSEHIAPLSFRFGLHLTPEFSSVKDKDGKKAGTYEFFNKPFGLRHWLEYGEGMGIDHDSGLPLKHDTIIALLDPDQMLIRPITGHFSSSAGDVFRSGSTGGNVDSPLSREGKPHFTVRHGHPLSQEYGFRDSWLKYASVAGTDSPATKVTASEALRSYAVGPPYVATAWDMYFIAVRWCEFGPKVYGQFPELMAEMYAFSIATADLNLPHQLMVSMMVSDTSGDGDGEGWKMVDGIPGEEVCPFAMNGLDADARPLPTAIHFCHRYGVGDHAFFAKKKMPTDFFSCESPLLEEPPMDIGSGKYLYKKPPFRDKKVEYSAAIEKREAFVICAATGFLNEAALYYKHRHCASNANVGKEIRLHDLPE